MPAREHRRRRRPAWIAGCFVLLAGAAGGCAGHRGPTLAERFVRGTDGYVEMKVPTDAAEARPPDVASPQVQPPPSPDVPTAETSDHNLGQALARAVAAPTAESLRRAGVEYHRLGIFDRAIEYLTKAVDKNPRDAGSYDARARVWRDWGQPDLALADAYRALHFAPDSADATNTLGTVLFALGRGDAAAAAFGRVLELAPDAAWAENNLCYVLLMAGREAPALDRCAAALRLAPDLVPAQHNLALVHAAAGRFDDAEAAFLAVGDRPTALYNIGIVLMARREYGVAVKAFERAYQERPSFDDARRRAAEARELAWQRAGK